MHPYGGTPICPRCSKAVYAAEQVMGPGRKLYHKPCLTCTGCNIRLDSLRLLEHDQEPYCKNCHSKFFGTRDLRQANLPHRADSTPSTPLSPTRTGVSLPSSPDSPPSQPTAAPPLPARKLFPAATIGRQHTGTFSSSPAQAPLLRPTRALSPTRATFNTPDGFAAVDEDDEDEDEQAFPPGTPTHAGRSQTGLPRTVPLTPGSPTKTAPPPPVSSPPPANPPTSLAYSPASVARAPAATFGRTMSPLTATATGTKYGVGLTGGLRATPTGGGRQWGGGTPQCPKCGKSVYFAEQVKAVGKTYHKACLRCTECGTSLDSSRLTEKDGQPLCHRCYGKLHGPQGSGYALLGKAGG
ncbi:LIM-domain-containing protein [Artomyces pyxidatus]|uniref:LIM-domain-containing protein n=1 Tax=Artomyces pyxidatus TaxID=48021 RepID=A0ACB8T585_9AGAM|nr:LIM-domain-containing protein [Artomyces pyxidatus]